MRKNTQFSLNIGLPSILLIFVVLCLISFGVLSFVSANADRNLSQKVMTRLSDYYKICNQAEEMLAEVNEQLMELYLTSVNEAAYWEKTQNIPNSYFFPLSELQDLQITLTFLYPEATEDDFFQINTWQVVTASDVEYDDELHVIP